MTFIPNQFTIRILAFVLLAIGTIKNAAAFPPAPHHLIYGMVRDESGNPLQSTNAAVIFETATGTKLTAKISPGLAPGLNYRIAIPMDSGITSDLYMPSAMRPSVSFRIRVRIDDAVFLPIEMAADYSRLGEPGQFTRLDLTLGVDSDGDGLPDAWERAIIASSGGKLSLREINPGDDSDGDGLTNLDEYIAGTYAFDKKDGYALKIVATTSTTSTLEFMAIRGRNYSIQASADLKTWTPVYFQINNGQSPVFSGLNYQASSIKVLRVEVDKSDAAELRFFKLMIQ